MATYAEFLIENGATPEEVKLLDTPVARKAYEKQQAAVAEAAVERQKAADLVRRNEEWRTQVETTNQQYLKERDSAKIEAARAAAAMKTMQELGLVEIAEKMEPGSTKPKEGETPAFDPKLLENYVDRNTLLSVAEQEGNAIALAQDIAWEHQQLFGNDPSKRLNFRALREEAKSRKIPFDRLWEEKFNVSAAREARAAKEKSEYEARIAAEAVTKYKSEHPETNPLLGPQVISATPFSKVVPSAAEKQPWLKSDAEKEIARTAKATAHLQQMGLVN